MRRLEPTLPRNSLAASQTQTSYLRRLFIFGVSVLTGCLFFSTIARSDPVLKNGFIDLSHWDFHKDGKVNLSRGEWQFLKGRFVDKVPQSAEAIKLPAVIRGDVLHGTVYIKIDLPQTSESLALKFDAFAPPLHYIIFDNNHKILAEGDKGRINRLHPNSKNEEVNGKAKIVEIGWPTSIHVFIQTSNYAWGDIPLGHPLILDSYRNLSMNSSSGGFLSAFLAGIFFLSSGYSFILFMQTRRQESLWIGMFSLFQLLRYSTTENFFFEVFPVSISSQIFIPWNNLAFLVANFFLPFLMLAIFLSAKNPLSNQQLRTTYVVLISLVLSIYVLATGTMITLSLMLCNLLNFIIGLYCGYQILTRDSNGASFKSLNVFSFIAPSYSVVHDMIFVSFGWSNIYINHWIILVFIVIQSALVGKRYAETFLENRRLLLHIQDQEKARTAFFHNTSHELRTPLNGIIGFLDLLIRGEYGQTNAKIQSQHEKIRRLAVSLKNQVNLILELAKSKRGNLEFKNSRVNLAEFMEDVESLAAGLQLKHPNSSFKMLCNWDGTASAPTFIHDRNQLMSLVRNLLGNSFKFARSAVENRIDLALELTKDGHFNISVSDQGIGIPEAYRQEIFGEFKQIQSDSRRSYEGTGLGLAMVKSIVDLAKGTIVVQSKEGEGSMFAISLPPQTEDSLQLTPIDRDYDAQLPTLKRSLSSNVHELQQQDSQDVQRGNDQRNSTELSKGKSILIVDDNEINCELVRDILHSQGFSAHISTGGRAALDYLNTHHPDMVLLDLMMPEVSGEDVLKAMRSQEILQDIPVILLTARASEEDRVLGLSMGADDYLAKPIIAQELLLRVGNLLKRIELSRISGYLESREKMALMGDLLAELSHEIKNVNSTFAMDQESSFSRIRLLWAALDLPPSAVFESLTRVEIRTGFQKRLDHLKIPSEKMSSRRPLEVLKIILASSCLNLTEIDQIWSELLEVDERQLQLHEAMISLSANVVRMSQSSRRTLELIEIILNYGRDPSPGESCSLREAIEDALKLLNLRILKLGISLEITIPSEVRVLMSKIELGQISLNLVHNAIDACELAAPNEKNLRIQSFEAADGLVHVLFKNSGSIPERARLHIFERGISTKGEKGSGLGLFISRRIAQRAQGNLVLTDETDEVCFDLSVKKVS